MTVHVLGIRHHGPGSARSVRAALAEIVPDAVVIEGAPELDAVAQLAGNPGLRPPVAGLVYDRDQPRRAAFYPLAEFSPEWVALQYAVARGIPVRFADLPAAVSLAGPGGMTPPGAGEDTPAPAPGADEAPEHASHDAAGVGHRSGPLERSDPVAVIARAAGYADPERWWEDAVEHRSGSTIGRFAAVSEAMRLVRASSPAHDDAENQRREAAMRRVIREVAAEHDRVVVVCGAFHAPALEPAVHPAKSADARLLAGLPKVKVGVTWAPWTNDRLRLASGYGAGVVAPGWYHHLFTGGTDAERRDGDLDVTTGWVVKVARSLRDQQLDAAPASAVEAVRLAEALAALRGRPAAGLEELDDASLTVLCEGQEGRLQLVRPRLYVGDELGTVPDETPMVPLAADLAATVRTLRLKQSSVATTMALDLRQPSQLARSVLLHRLRILGIEWGRPAETGRTTGTFKEAWELVWQPELTVGVIEASLYGTTVQSAAAAVVRDRARVADLAGLGALVEVCLLADLPTGLATVVEQLGVRSALNHDVRRLLEAVEPLARTVRYGDVRGVATADVRALVEVIVMRACVGLPAGCQSLNDDLAAEMRRAMDAAHGGVRLLQQAELSNAWWSALRRLGPTVHGTVGGRADRLLLDAGEIGGADAADRMALRLSASDTSSAATWLEAFLGSEALLLLHDRTLFALVDDWLAGIPERLFDDILPLVRRTFARFTASERQQVASAVLARGGRSSRTEAYAAPPDLRRASAALATTARLLGRGASGYAGTSPPGNPPRPRRTRPSRASAGGASMTEHEAQSRDRLRRWRLVLGGSAASCGDGVAGDDCAWSEVRLDAQDRGRDEALEALYDAGQRRGGLGASSPKVSRWLGDIRGYFPSSVVQVMQRDAMDRLGLRRLLLEPEMLRSVQPDLSLVTTLVGLSGVIPPESMETARAVVRTVTDQLQERLRSATIQAVTGALNRASRTRRPRMSDIDWGRTVRANLKHYQPELRTVIPERLVGYARRSNHVERQIILCIDQSGSMAASVVYASVFGAVLASLRSVATRLVVFDTAVVDLTDEIDDPVDVLFGVQLGGGTDINGALAYCQGLISSPQETILVLISDLYEGGIAEEMIRRSRSIVGSGATMIALLALSDQGAPAFDADHAEALAAIGVPAFACTPDLFPDLMAAAIEGRDVAQWAAANDIVTAGVGD